MLDDSSLDLTAIKNHFRDSSFRDLTAILKNFWVISVLKRTEIVVRLVATNLNNIIKFMMLFNLLKKNHGLIEILSKKIKVSQTFTIIFLLLYVFF